MNKKLNRHIEITVEESEKAAIVDKIIAYLANNEDYINGDIEIKSDREEIIDVFYYNDCEGVPVVDWMNLYLND